MQRSFCEDTPGEDKENSDDHLEDGKEPPSRNVGNGRVSRTGLRGFEELGGHTVLGQDPTTKDVSQNDREEGDSIFETRAIVDGLGVLVHHEQAE